MLGHLRTIRGLYSLVWTSGWGRPFDAMCSLPALPSGARPAAALPLPCTIWHAARAQHGMLGEGGLRWPGRARWVCRPGPWGSWSLVWTVKAVHPPANPGVVVLWTRMMGPGPTSRPVGEKTHWRRPGVLLQLLRRMGHYENSISCSSLPSSSRQPSEFLHHIIVSSSVGCPTCKLQYRYQRIADAVSFRLRAQGSPNQAFRNRPVDSGPASSEPGESGPRPFMQHGPRSTLAPRIQGKG
jgi:hypothetical protein